MKLCSIEGCNSGVKTKGYCQKHYQEQYRNKRRAKRQSGLCIADNCNSVATRGRYCPLHFENWVTFGRANHSKGLTNEKMDCLVDGCTGVKSTNGYCQKHNYRLKKYGQLTIPNKTDIHNSTT
ncbi:hypothetical protein [Bacillus toyonensis]|uniref:hypothetical protein n=1 Tax=Bacillus toyonensis TaxID=155322 RepID=UPI00159BED5F|nr:hypothetical protein [Bacillus toyonensis]